MRKLAIMLVLCLVLLLPAFCEDEENTSASTTLDFTAYKNPALPDLRYEIRIGNFENPNIIGTTSSYSVTSANQTTTNALIIEVDTNLRNDITIGVYFYPFINEYDPYDLYSVTYTTTTSMRSATTVENCSYGTDKYAYSAKWVFGGEFSTKNDTTTITSISGSGAYGTLTSKITAAKLSNGSYVNQNNIPRINGTDTLPGIGENKVTNRIVFNMKPNFGDKTPQANMKYISRVRLVISSV